MKRCGQNVHASKRAVGTNVTTPARYPSPNSTALDRRQVRPLLERLLR